MNSHQKGERTMFEQLQMKLTLNINVNSQETDPENKR